MEVYVSKNFLAQIELKSNDAFKKRNFSHQREIAAIMEFINTGSINKEHHLISNFSPEEIINSVQKNLGRKDFDSIQEQFIFTLFKNPSRTENFNFIAPTPTRSYIFIGEDTKIDVNKGGIIINYDNNQSNFFLTSIVANRDFLNEYDWIKEIYSPCNSMLYIDPYFMNTDSIQQKLKLNEFITFLSSIIDDNLNIDFHLTILTNKFSNGISYSDGVFDDTIMEIQSHFPGIKIEIFATKIIIDKNNSKYRDRLFFTNYTKGSFGHPGDNRLTTFSNNFMAASNEIRSDFDDYFTSLKYWQKLILNLSSSSNKYTDAHYTNTHCKNFNRIFDSN